MTKERDLLARAGLIVAEYRWRDSEDKALRELSQQINEYFEEPEPEQESTPIVYWDTQNGTLIPAVPLSSERTCFKVPLVPLYLHPAPRQFVRLTDEEILEIVGPYSDAVGGYTRKLFDTIQDKLEEKNNG